MDLQLMDVKRQHEEHAKEYEAAALSVLRSGKYIGGEEVDAFESEFSDYMGAEYGISCGNGTDALVLALRAIGLEPGDEVITVAFTFFATAESIAAVGAIPVFIDVDPSTYCMDPNKIEQAITKKTKAILPVHLYGNSADMDSITAIAKKHNLYVVVDCAQATGTRLHGKRKSILGDISCFSFFPTKTLGCSGDGGMVLTDNEQLARICRALKVHGSGEDGFYSMKKMYEDKRMEMPDDIPLGTNKYYNYLIGYNSRLDAVQAAILRQKLHYLDDFIARRRKNASYYNENLNNTGYVLPKEERDSFHSYYLYVVRHKNAGSIIDSLHKKGISCGTYYPIPLHLQGAFAALAYKKGELPVTEMLCKETFAIPVFPEMKKSELSMVVIEMKKLDIKR